MGPKEAEETRIGLDAAGMLRDPFLKTVRALRRRDKYHTQPSSIR